MQDGSGSDSDDELPPVRQAFLRNGSQGRSAQQLEESDSEEAEPSRPAQPAAKASTAAAGRSSKAAAPTRASGTSKPKPRAGGKAPAPAASERQEASKGPIKRTASGKAHSQQQEPSGSTAGGSVAGGSPASQLNSVNFLHLRTSIFMVPIKDDSETHPIMAGLKCQSDPFVCSHSQQEQETNIV